MEANEELKTTYLSWKATTETLEVATTAMQSANDAYLDAGQAEHFWRQKMHEAIAKAFPS